MLRKITWIILPLVLLTNSAIASICVDTSKERRALSLAVQANSLDTIHKLAFAEMNFTDYKLLKLERGIKLLENLQSPALQDCDVILGIYSSLDCLLTAKYFKKVKKLGFSPSCGHNNLAEFNPYFYTLLPPVSQFTIKSLQQLQQLNIKPKVYLIHQPTNIYSQNELNAFTQAYPGKITKINVTHYGDFDPSPLLKNPHQDAVLVFFGYVVSSAQVLFQLEKLHLINKHISIIGSSEWHTAPSILISLQSTLRKAKQAIMTDIMPEHTQINPAFLTKFHHAFKRQPLLMDLLTYDTAQLTAKCYRQIKRHGDFTPEKFQHCLTQHVYHGVSGDFSFKPGSVFAERPIYLVNILERI